MVRHLLRLAVKLPITLALMVLCSGAMVPATAQETVPGNRASSANAPLKVAVRESPPFTTKDQAGNWEGLSVALWQDVADKLNLQFEWVEIPLDETFDALSQGRADVAITALSITPQRESQVDFSHPYLVSGLARAFNNDSGSSAWLGTASAFVSWEFLSAIGSLIVVLLGAGLLVWIFERKENAEEFGHGSVSRGLGDGFWWSAVTMTTVGYGDKSPKTLGGRIVGLIWMFTSLIIIASFTASIAASLTANRLSNDRIRTTPIADLRVATVENSSALGYVRSQGGRVQTFGGLQEALSALRDGRAEIVVYDAPILKWWARTSFQNVSVGEQILVRDDYGFAFAEDSPLRKRVNTGLLQILREPVWQGIKRRYLGDS